MEYKLFQIDPRTFVIPLISIYIAYFIEIILKHRHNANKNMQTLYKS